MDCLRCFHLFFNLLGLVAEKCPEVAVDAAVLPSVLQALSFGISAEPRVAHNACVVSHDCSAAHVMMPFCQEQCTGAPRLSALFLNGFFFFFLGSFQSLGLLAEAAYMVQTETDEVGDVQTYALSASFRGIIDALLQAAER